MNQQHPFPGRVLLRVTAEVNGHKVSAEVAAERPAWDAIPGLRDQMEAEAMRLLGERIVKELAPEITVIGAEPTLQESLTQALRPFDYPGEY